MRFLPRLAGWGVGVALLALGLLGGCTAVAPPVVSPRATAVPSTFVSAANAPDSASVAQLSWQKFFADSALVALVDTALRANPDQLIAVQRVEEARAGLVAARGALLPIVSAGATGGFDRFADYAALGQT
ncbi:MAG: TolC family protein, partial [Hymenobacter sp.]|nr:TolC family protein [Hymenobacter sp.]